MRDRVYIGFIQKQEKYDILYLFNEFIDSL